MVCGRFGSLLLLKWFSPSCWRLPLEGGLPGVEAGRPCAARRPHAPCSRRWHVRSPSIRRMQRPGRELEVALPSPQSRPDSACARRRWGSAAPPSSRACGAHQPHPVSGTRPRQASEPPPPNSDIIAASDVPRAPIGRRWTLPALACVCPMYRLCHPVPHGPPAPGKGSTLLARPGAAWPWLPLSAQAGVRPRVGTHYVRESCPRTCPNTQLRIHRLHMTPPYTHLSFSSIGLSLWTAHRPSPPTPRRQHRRVPE